MKKRLNRHLLQVQPSSIRAFNQFAQENGTSLFLTLGEPDFPTPLPVKEAAIQALQNEHTKYAPNQGSLDLREAICSFERQQNQTDYQPNEVLVTAGSTEALSTALATMLNPGDEVIILLPAYPLYRQLIQRYGASCAPIDTAANHFQVSQEMLEAVITDRTKAIILNSPNNPTGTLLNQESLAAIHAAVKEHNLFVVCDDVYNQLVFSEGLELITQYPDIRNSIVICQSFSKPYAMTGWRIGYMLADGEFIEEALKVHQSVLSCVTTFVQDAAIAALDYDTSEMVESYRVRRDYVYDRLQAMGFDVALPEGTFYMFPSIRKFGLSSWEFCQRLVREQGVALIPGSCFEADDFIRISFCVDRDTLTEALDRLEAFLSQF